MAPSTLHDEKNNFLRHLAWVEAGVTLKRRRRVAARPAFPAPVPQRRFGSMRGLIELGPDFFDPLPEEELSAWGL